MGDYMREIRDWNKNAQPSKFAEEHKKLIESGKEKKDDEVNPSHYKGKVECIDAMEVATEGLEGIEAVCTANVMKYIWRWKKKGGVTDLKKAEWYLKRLIERVERNESSKVV